jgi:hypothetical protein
MLKSASVDKALLLLLITLESHELFKQENDNVQYVPCYFFLQKSYKLHISTVANATKFICFFLPIFRKLAKYFAKLIQNLLDINYVKC